MGDDQQRIGAPQGRCRSRLPLLALRLADACLRQAGIRADGAPAARSKAERARGQGGRPPSRSQLEVYAPPVFFHQKTTGKMGKSRRDHSEPMLSQVQPCVVTRAPEANDVSAIVVDGTTIYVAGGFTQIGGEARPGLAALDAATGLATAWAPTDFG